TSVATGHRPVKQGFARAKSCEKAVKARVSPSAGCAAELTLILAARAFSRVRERRNSTGGLSFHQGHTDCRWSTELPEITDWNYRKGSEGSMDHLWTPWRYAYVTQPKDH